MIERVDLPEIVPVRRSPSFQFVGVDVNDQSVRKLVRIERHIPEWEEIGRHKQQCRYDDHRATSQIDGCLEERCRHLYILLHGSILSSTSVVVHHAPAPPPDAGPGNRGGKNNYGFTSRYP